MFSRASPQKTFAELLDWEHAGAWSAPAEDETLVEFLVHAIRLVMHVLIDSAPARLLKSKGLQSGASVVMGGLGPLACVSPPVAVARMHVVMLLTSPSNLYEQIVTLLMQFKIL